MAHTEYNVPGQTNLATVNTFYLGKPAPIVAERIWDTKTKAEAYIHDTVGSALAGIILRVTDDTTNNGAYLVEKDISATNGLKLSKFITGTDSNTWRNIKVKTSASGTATEILSTSSTLPLTLTADSNITLTAVQDTNNEYTGEIKISASGGGNDTWRNIYVNGGNSETIGTGTDTKAINYTAGDGITISYLAAGTGTGQSGNANYFSVKTTLNTAGNNTLGGIKLGYTQSGRNMALETDSDKAYVNTHTTNMNTVYIAGTNITLSTPTTTDYILTSTDVYNDADSSMFRVQLTPTVTTFNNDTIIKVRFPSNVISSKRLVFYTGTNASNNLVSCYNDEMYSTGTKWFYPSSNILHSDMYYYFIKKASPNGFVYLGTNVQSITASGGGSANDTTITLQGGASAASSTWSDSFTTNASTAKTIYVPVMTGASSSDDGDMGLVPKPLKNNSDYTKFLRGDGTWQTVSGGTTDSFKTIAVSGQSSVVADSSTDTLTLVAGTGMTITTNASTDTITFASSGGGGIEGMRAYSVIPANIIQPSPMEFVLRLFDPIVKDYASNDVTVFTDKMKASEGGGFDGHIPVGSMILFYAAYLNSKSLTSGRLVWDTPGMGDYFNYIICNGGSTLYESTDPNYGDEQALNDNTVTLFTFNWATYGGNGLPDGINDWVSSYAGRSDIYNLNFTSKTVYDDNGNTVNVVGASPTPNIGVTLLGGSANTYITHRYTFHISDIEPGDGIDSLTNIIAELRNSGAASAYTKLKNDDIFQSKTAFFKNIVVSLDHRSCVTGEGASIFYGKPSE